jgi:membrane fusion protein, multidrug efflux system
MMKTSNRKYMIIIAAAGLLILVLVAVFRKGEGSTSATSTQSSVPVEIIRMTPAPLTEAVSAVGTIAALHDVEVGSETAGRVTAVHVNVGDAVRQGGIIVTVDDELRQAALAQAESALLAARTNLEKSRHDMEREEKLRASGDISDLELESYRLALRAAEAQEKGAAAGAQTAQRQVNDTRISAPLAGVVAARYVDAGEMVGPGQHIANIVDLSALKIRVSIPEESIALVKDHQPVTVSVDACAGKIFHGEVLTVGDKAESPTAHTYPVEVRMANPAGSGLKAGMFATVAIQTRTRGAALAVSKDWLVGDLSAPQVYLVVDHVAHLSAVKLGAREGNRMEVVDGLKEGDLVVSFGQNGLKDGLHVTYK